jgi:hypothetical protein
MNYVLLGADGRPYRSDVKGRWGVRRYQAWKAAGHALEAR